MKNALILHGTQGNSQENWFPWLKQKLEEQGYQVWVPDLPQADNPNIERYNAHLFANQNFRINEDTIIIGHSSGAVAIFGLLQSLPADVTVNACYLVGSFKDDLGWDALSGLFEIPFDYEKIKTRSRLWYFIHSDNDPYCPLDHAKYLHKQIGGDLIILCGQKNFSVGTFGEAYRTFPYLYHLIAGDMMTASDVVTLYTKMEEQEVLLWLDGGWGVDALLGEQTRTHGDVDVVVQRKDLKKLDDYLRAEGYWEIFRSDTSPHNFMLSNDRAKLIDIHVIELDGKGNGIYGPEENGVMYEAGALTGEGEILNHTVKCIAPRWVVKYHTGYKLRKNDYHDVLLICKKYGIEVPEEYRPHI